MDQTAAGHQSVIISSERQLRTLLNDVQVGILVMSGPEFIVEMANKTYLQIVDRQESQFIGRSLFETLPEVREIVEPLLTNVLNTGIPYYGNEFPVVLNRYGGSELAYFNFVYHPAYDESGVVIGITVVANEVTSLVLAKQALIESEKKFRNMVMQSPIAVTILKGEDFVIDLANRRMLETLWRRQESDVMGKKILDVFPELKNQKFPDLLRKVYREKVVHTEYEALAYVDGPDGMRKFYLDFTYEPLVDNTGKVFGIQANVTDVTEKVEVRMRVEEAEAKLRLALESADLGTYELDFSTNEVKTSERFNEIWGITSVTDRNVIASRIHSEDRSTREAAHRQALLTGALHYEARVLRPNGSQLWVRLKGKILYDKEKKPLTLIGVVQDITEQKQFSDELERKVNERTEALQAANEEIAATNEELSQANNNLVKANLDLEQFNYAASHDLQEPVRKILTYANFLLDSTELASSQRNFSHVEKIKSAADRMKSIISDLLVYSHNIRGETQFVPTDLNVVLRNIKTDLDLMIEQKNATLEVGDLPVIVAVPGQMHQLFLNLVSNSLKFTRPETAPKIQITARPATPDTLRKRSNLKQTKRYVHITVRDNGVGFEQKFAEYIFQLFKRLHAKHEYSGTGIGLSLCKKIADNHLGDIYAESELGSGTVMNIILPLSAVG